MAGQPSLVIAAQALHLLRAYALLTRLKRELELRSAMQRGGRGAWLEAGQAVAAWLAGQSAAEALQAPMSAAFDTKASHMLKMSRVS